MLLIKKKNRAGFTARRQVQSQQLFKLLWLTQARRSLYSFLG